MVHKIILDRTDIEKIVAKEFNVPHNKVTLYLEDEMVGYGTDEHVEKVAVIEVMLDSPKMDWERGET